MNLKTAIIFAKNKFQDKAIISAPLDAEILLLEAINQNRADKIEKSWLYLNFEKYILSKKEENLFKNFVKRREKYEPIAYLIGKKEFYGIDFFVDKNVLIPRVETELIVNEVISILENFKGNLTLIDIGTGSGCIPISILKSTSTELRKVYANDISFEALEVARKNAKQHKVSSKITFLKCDLGIALEKIKTCDNLILTANLPYITPEDYKKLTPNVKNFEPKIALTTKDKGLYHITRLIEKFARLSANTRSYCILLEADPKQMRSIKVIAEKNLRDINIEIIKDLRGRKRVLKITRK